MKFKDFTQEAYDDIQSYMGGEEQWEESVCYHPAVA